MFRTKKEEIMQFVKKKQLTIFFNFIVKLHRQ